ncbi:MAG: hypothetical protein II351_00050 [Clostridia bacterium]|nr:hypothetical protein [Clostridia bacterium]
MNVIQFEELQYQNYGKCLKVSNGKVAFIATLDIGIRIISLAFEGKKNFFLEDLDRQSSCAEAEEKFGAPWYIWGGHRIWQSPEAKPRSYASDHLPVSVTKLENSVRITAPQEQWTLAQKEIEITFDPKNDCRLIVKNRVTNHGAWPYEFSVWALSVMAAGGVEIIPMNNKETGLLGNRVLALWPYTNMADPRVTWGDKYITLRQDPNATCPFKLGLNNERSWAAYFLNGDAFIKGYTHVDGETYPDFGVSYETYTGNLMLEMESLSPLKSVDPEETVELVETWTLVENVALPENEAEMKAFEDKFCG